jgi:uncharacterized membrane protein YidH (DUF202 family)
MKPLRIIGVFLITLGIVMIVTGGFRFKQREKVIDTNTIDLTIKKEKAVTWPWFAGGIAVIGGIALLLIGSNKRK